MTWAVDHTFCRLFAFRNSLLHGLLFSYRPGRVKGWVSLVGWLIADSLVVYPQSSDMSSYWSGAGQGKFAGQRPTFYSHCTTPPTTVLRDTFLNFATPHALPCMCSYKWNQIMTDWLTDWMVITHSFDFFLSHVNKNIIHSFTSFMNEWMNLCRYK